MIWFLEGRRRALGDKAWGFLDGANQGTLGICGTGAVFFINNHHSFTLKCGVGHGTNSRVEFFELWVLNKFSLF